MIWFLIALSGPFLYALTNHIDKILLEKYFKQSGVGTLLLFSALVSALPLPLFFLADTTILDIDPQNIAVMAVVGILNFLVLWCYLVALQDEEASVTIVFYQLVPVFGYVLGYFILNETLTQMQILSMAIIILGTTIISFEIDSENKLKLRRKTVPYMVAASFFWAAGSVVFKMVALEENLWRSLFWEHLTLVVIGIILFVGVRSYREHFLLAIKENSTSILSLNILNEVLFMLGNFAFSYAYMLVPVALVLVTESFQPIFVLAIGIFLTLFFPKISVEKIQARYLYQKLIAISITGVGTYMLLAL